MQFKVILVITLFIATACAYPQEEEYDDYDYPEEEVEYGDPPQFQTQPLHLVAKEGETIKIPCQPTESSPYVITIQKAKTDTQPEKLMYVGDVKVQKDRRYKLNDSQVEISNLRRSDSGTYICRIQADPFVEMSHELDVQYAPTVSAISESEQRVQKGESVILECKATGNPSPVIQWSRPGGRMPSGAKEEEGYSLTLAEVDRHVEGTYVCTANNDVGEPVSASMSVMVEYSPEIITEKAIIRTDTGDKIELVCIVHARPAATVTWTKDGNPLTLDEHLEKKEGGHRHALWISQVSEEDFGEYVCTAENEYDVVESSINMTGTPKVPHFTSDPNGGEEMSYTLTWETESYYPITHYRLKYRKAKANDSTDEPGDWHDMTYEAVNVETSGLIQSMKHTIDDLEAATDYHASLQVRNQFKSSHDAEFAFSTRKAPLTTPTTSTTTSTQTTITLPTTQIGAENDGPSDTSNQEEVTGQQTIGASANTSPSVYIVLTLLAALLFRT